VPKQGGSAEMPGKRMLDVKVKMGTIIRHDASIENPNKAERLSCLMGIIAAIAPKSSSHALKCVKKNTALGLCMIKYVELAKETKAMIIRT
jgi:hypothetical protein